MKPWNTNRASHRVHLVYLAPLVQEVWMGLLA